MIESMAFEQWKAEYQPRVYEDSGAECFDHEDECDCEFLYTVELTELDEEDANAVAENRIWTWRSDGSIVSGVESERADLLITQKSYQQEMEIH
jgi:hypothetical protein